MVIALIAAGYLALVAGVVWLIRWATARSVKLVHPMRPEEEGRVIDFVNAKLKAGDYRKVKIFPVEKVRKTN